MDAATPEGWCVAVMARVVNNNAALIESLEEIQSRLSGTGDLYLYPRASFHVSLLGCTQRESAHQAGQAGRLENILRAYDRAALDTPAMSLELGGLNLVGNQFFVEVFTEEPTWKKFRERLAAELVGIGEQPLTHADPEPIHLNIARILRLDNPDDVRRLLTQERPAVNAVLEISQLELVITDFVVAPEKLQVLDTKALSASRL